jgi:hypothetical protein
MNFRSYAIDHVVVEGLKGTDVSEIFGPHFKAEVAFDNYNQINVIQTVQL